MATESSWWLDKYDIGKDSYKSYKSSKTESSWWKSSYKSATKGWMEKLGGFGWFDYYNNEDKERKLYKKVLNQLQTSINVISGERELKVRWSDGESQNTPESPIVHVSPDNLINKNKNIEEDTLDVLTGKVYLSSILNKQINKEDYKIACGLRGKASKNQYYLSAVKLWEALETNIAKKFIEENWCGFMPHIIKHGESTHSDKKTVQSFINETSEGPNLQAVISGIAWNLVNPDNTVVIPKVYEKCIDAAVEILEDPEVENKRFNGCQSIVRKIQEILQEQENKEKELGDGEGGEESSENDVEPPDDVGEKKSGNSENKTKSSSGGGSRKIEKEFEKLKFTDSELFGMTVKNNTDHSISEIKNDKDEASGDTTTEMDGIDLSALKNEFVVPEYCESYNDEYKNIVFDLKSCIESVKNNFYFINNKMFLNSYGHNTGDVDENNLHKIFLNDDRLMQKRDIISQKKVSICLLIDESGSMEDKYIEARNTAIILAEGLKSYFDVSIYGHTAEDNVRGCTITEYFTPRNKYIQTCIEIVAKCENVDGLAIELVAKKFTADYPESRKIVFVISDGEPASTYYGGRNAREHVNRVCEMVRNRLETEVYGIGVCEAYSDEMGEELYGSGNYVILEDVMSSIGIITRFLKQICNKNTKVLS